MICRYNMFSEFVYVWHATEHIVSVLTCKGYYLNLSVATQRHNGALNQL